MLGVGSRNHLLWTRKLIFFSYIDGAEVTLGHVTDPSAFVSLLVISQPRRTLLSAIGFIRFKKN